MQLKTILNRCYKFKHFVYESISQAEGNLCLEVTLRARRGSAVICSSCHKPAPVYDRTRKERRFEFIPVWGIPVFFLYVMRRVNCAECGVKVEEVPWGDGKHQLTKAYMQFLSSWARSLSWKEVAKRFGTSWEKVVRSVEYIVEWGLKHRSLEGITSIGVDEIQ